MYIKSTYNRIKIIFLLILSIGFGVFGFYNTQKAFADLLSFTQNKWTVSDATKISTSSYASSTWGYYSTSSGATTITQDGRITLTLPIITKTISGNEFTTSTIDTGVQFSSTTFAGSTNAVGLIDTGIKRDDLVVQNETGFSFYNLQTNTWQNTNIVLNGSLVGNLPIMTFGDVDEDGDLDALVISSKDAQFFRNNNGIFTAAPATEIGLGVGISSSTEIKILNGGSTKTISFVDTNNDKRIDYLAMADNGQNKLAYIPNISTTTDVNFDSNADQYFFTPSTAMGPGFPTRPRIAFQDLNGDNISDIVLGSAKDAPITSSYNGILYIFLNNGGGSTPSFRTTQNIYGWNPEYTISQQGPTKSTNPYYKDFGDDASVAFGDFSGDGIADLAVAHGDNVSEKIDYYIGVITSNGEWKGTPSSIAPLTFSAYSAVSPTLNDFLSDRTYLTAGNYISPRIDSGESVFFRNFNVAASTPSGTTMVLQTRTGTMTGGGFPIVSPWQSVGANGAVSAPSSARFIQFKADLTTNNTSQTPSFNLATVQYTTAANGVLISSPFNTENKYSALSSIVWDEGTPSGTSVMVSLRSASSTGDLALAQWEDFTSATVGCSKISNTVTCSNLPLSLKTGSDDQFFQYRISLVSDGLNVPEISRIKINYSVNAAPIISSFVVAQIATSTDPHWGKVRVQYNLKDVDTLSNSVGVMFEYSTGTAWNFLSSSTRALSQIHTEIFNREAFPSQMYDPALKMRIMIDDGADVNNSTSLESTFVLDTKSPTIIMSVLDSRLDQLNLIVIDENNGLKMRISNYDDFRDATIWRPFATSVAWTATSTINSTERAYFEVQDRLGNVSSKTIEAPAPPTTLNAIDASDAHSNLYRIQLIWASSTDANFLNYQVYRKSNMMGDTIYRLVSPLITNRTQNFYVDANLLSSTLYYYRVVVEDVNHNISNYSSEVIEQPDDINGPLIQFKDISGNSLEATSTVTIPINISAISSQPVSVSYMISGGSATQGTDYIMNAGIATIPTGETSTTISFSVLDDSIYENDEIFIITLSNPQGSRLGSALSYTHTIKNNDSPPSVSFLNASSTVGENGETITIPVVLNTISGATTSIEFSLGGTASFGVDYTITPTKNTLIIPQGVTTTSLSLTTINDTVYEGDESVLITLSPNNDVVLGLYPSFISSIKESVLPPFVEFDTNESSSRENDGKNNGITLTLSNIFSIPVKIFYTIEGTAHGDFETKEIGDMWTARYSLLNATLERKEGEPIKRSGFVTIPTGITHVELPLTILNNNIYQGDETIILTLNTLENVPYRIQNKITHIHTIHDDDAPPQIIWGLFEKASAQVEIISPSHVKVQENIQGQVDLELKAQLSSALEKNVEVPFTLIGAEGDTRIVTQQNTIAIPAGAKEGKVILSFFNNEIYEGNKDIQVTLQSLENVTVNPLNKVFLVTLIDDEEPVRVDFKNASQGVRESDATTIEIPVALSSIMKVENSIPFTIGGTLSSERIKIVSDNSSLIIPEGEQEGIIRIIVSGDQVYRGNETIVISLSPLQGIQLGTVTQHTITIEDDDLPPNVAFVSESQSVSENNGNISIQITLSTPSLFPVHVSFATSGTALQGQDYTIEGSLVSIPAGSINATIPITLVNDTSYRGTRTLTLTLTNSNFAQLGLYKVHTVTITDDEMPLDTTPPIITIKSPVIIDTMAVIQWDTDELAKGSVMFGRNANTLSLEISEQVMSSSHMLALPNLSSSTDYYYAVVAQDNTGNKITSPVQSFKTLGVISGAVTQEIFNALEEKYNALLNSFPSPSLSFLLPGEIIKEQNQEISIPLRLSYTTEKDLEVQLKMEGNMEKEIDFTLPKDIIVIPAGTKEGNIVLTILDDLIKEDTKTLTFSLVPPSPIIEGLLPTFTLTLEDDDGISSDTTPPIITNNGVVAGDTFAVIDVITDEPTVMSVNYGTVSGNLVGATTEQTPSLTHAIILSHLIASTTYYYNATAVDNAGNTGTLNESSFITKLPGGVDQSVYNELRALYDNLSSSSVAKSDYDLLSQKYDQALIDIQTLQSQIGTATGTISQADYDALVAERNTIQAELTSLQALFANGLISQAQFDELTANYNQLLLDYQTLQAQVGSGNGAGAGVGVYTQADIDALNAQLTTLQAQLTSLQGSAAELAAVRAAYLALQLRVNALQIEVEKAKNKIEKDTIAPLITEIAIKNIGAFDATITWHTDEPASSFVSYQEASSTTTSTLSAGSPFLVKDHSVKLSRLTTATNYSFYVAATDNFSNIASSTPKTFKTLFVAESTEGLVQARDVEQFQQELGKFIESSIPSLAPPVMSNIAIQNIGEKEATITWQTNIEGSSLVAFAKDGVYDSTKEDAYGAEMGDTLVREKKHSVILKSLEPGTQYHIQLRSATKIGTIGKSKDITFTTKFQKLEITLSEISDSGVLVGWITTRPTASFVEYKDIKKGIATKEGNEVLTTTHLMRLNNLIQNTAYEIRGFGADVQGNVIESNKKSFTTLIDTKPPVISAMKIEHALMANRNDRLQTIVFWKTDEPATSQIEYDEGPGNEILKQKTALEGSLTTNHVMVLNNIKPGTVYRVRVVTSDKNNNSAKSSVQSLLTPQKGESIFDIIGRNFEQSFGWLRALQ